MSPTYSNTIIEFCQNISTIKLATTINPQEIKLKTELKDLTAFLSDNASWGIRCYCVKNNIHAIPQCICGNNCLENKLGVKHGFTKYCSPKCVREYSKIPQDVYTKVSNKEWLHQQRIILKKSKDTIAQELGCTVPVINRWIKIHGIPKVRYNESHTEIKLLKILKKDLQNLEPNISISNPHQEIIDFITSFYDGKIIINDRTVLNGLELDIYIPDKNLAIEYGSIFSHLYRPHETNFSKRKDKNYHIKKTMLCEAKGIQLLQIFGEYWKKDIWKSIIRNKLGCIENKIYARKCQIAEISVSEKNLFLDENHLQGRDKSVIKYGLFHNNELVALATFGKSRYNKSSEWECIRFCNKKNLVIVGGFSKLLAHFKKNHQGSIISYADRTYSQGDLYSKHGFMLVKINPPAYYWVKKNSEIMEHRSNFKKNNITSSPNDPRTEEQIMMGRGYSKIFNCGTKTYVLMSN